jgi:hypothetical protein
MSRAIHFTPAALRLDQAAAEDPVDQMVRMLCDKSYISYDDRLSIAITIGLLRRKHKEAAAFYQVMGG